MRNAILVLLLTGVLALGSATAFAGAPLPGVYKPTSTGGPVINGREASSWTSSPDGFLNTGNVLLGESWNGSALGTQWRILCPVVAQVNVIDPGDGFYAIYEFVYAGGVVVLDGSGPWGNGDALYTGTIDSYREVRNILYDGPGGPRFASDSDHEGSASIVGYPRCLNFIFNGVYLNDTDNTTGTGPKPANYPSYRDANCNATPTIGHWGDLRDLTLTIVQGCEVATEAKSWGAVKALYRD